MILETVTQKSTKPMKTEYVEFHPDFWHIKINSAIDELKKVLEEIPEEYRDTAVLMIEAEEEYGSPTTSYSISYKRPMTEQEIENSTLSKQRQIKERKQWLKRQLADLEKNT